MNDQEAAFQREMLASVAEMKSKLGYNPTYFQRMIADHGAVDAARRLIHAPNPSEGFTRLWDAHRLDMTAEAHALLPRYEELFSEEDREQARSRLEQHGFHVVGFVETARSSGSNGRTAGA